MNQIIFNLLFKRLNDTKVKLMLATISYYSIIALIPTLVIVIFVLKLLSIDIYFKYQFLFDLILKNSFSNTIIFIIAIFMISRIFYTILKSKFTPIKSFLISFFFSIFLVLFLSIYFFSYTIENTYLNILIKFTSVTIFLFLLLYLISNANFKYSLLFSISFSIISNLFLLLFTLVGKYFINYENYYGLLAPIFLIILAIHLFIYLIIIAYVSAEEFTKISRIKFIKC